MVENLRRFLVLSALLGAMAQGRTLEEIKKSGVLYVGMREKSTVFERVTNRDTVATNGLHWKMVEQFAASLKVVPRVLLATNIPQYFAKQSDGSPQFFSQVDLYADNLTLTEERQRAVEFTKIYDVVQVCLLGKGVRVQTLEDLASLPTSVAVGSTYEEQVQQIASRLKTNLSVIKVPDTTRQVADLLGGKTAWTVLDSDQAFFQASRNRQLTVSLEAFKQISSLKGIGWGFPKSPTGPNPLGLEVKRFLTNQGDRYMDRFWRETYGISREEYYRLVSIIDARGEGIIKSALGSYISNQFPQARDQLRLAMQARISSAQLLKLYDRIYQRLCEAKFTNSEAEPFPILDEYYSQQPTRDMTEWLKATWPGIWDDYLRYLAARRKALQQVNLLDAIAVQESLLALDPTADNRTTLRLLILQRAEQERALAKASEPQVAVADSNRSATEAPLPAVAPAVARQVDEWRGKEQGPMELAVATLAIAPEELVQVPLELPAPAAPPTNAVPVFTHQVQVTEVPVTNNGRVVTNSVLTTNQVAVAPVVDTRPMPVITNTDDAGDREGYRLWTEAEIAISNRAWSDALRPLRSCISLKYRTPEAKALMDRCLAGLKEDEAAAARKKQEAFDLSFRSALEHYFAGRNSDAYEAIAKCLDLFPDSGPAKKYYQMISDRLRLESEAKIDNLSPYLNYFKTRIGEVDQRMAVSNWSEAKTLVEEILALFPRNEDARERLLVCVYNQDPKAFEGLVSTFYQDVMAGAKSGDRQRGIRGLRLIQKLKPDFQGVGEQLARLIAEDRAELIGIPPPVAKASNTFDAAATLKQAEAFASRGDTRSAWDLVQQILRRYPSHYEANITASRLENEMRRQEQETRMVAAVQTALAPPADAALAESWFLKGQFFFRVGDYASTISCWENACQAAPDNAILRRQLDRVKKLAKY